MNYRKVYKYTYACCGKRKWIRMSVDDALGNFASKYKHYDIYTTIQTYKSRIEEDSEDQWCPLFFDFDSPRDCTDEVILEEVRQDVINLINFFSSLGVPDELLRVWWSGGRGFHIIAEPEIFGIEPNKELTRIVKQCAATLIERLSLKHIDRKIYTIKRMWRVPNSLNASSNLYKIELLKDEVKKMSVAEIKELAKKPRQTLYSDIDYDAYTPDLDYFWKQFLAEYDSFKEMEKLKPRKIISIPKGEAPKCVEDILSNSLKITGTRNRTIMALASFFKDTGYSQDETIASLVAFSKKIPNGLSKSSDAEKEENCRAVARSVFEGKTYNFSCAFIRSLGIAENPVKCDSDICKYVKAEDQEPIEPIVVDLYESSKASFVGLPLKISCMISGKDTTPYQIPRHIKIECVPSNKPGSQCEFCKLRGKGGIKVVRISPSDPILLEMINITKKNLHAIVTKIAGIPSKCYLYKSEIMDYGNMVDVQLIPRVKFSIENITQKTEYSVRRGLYVGHDIAPSEEYELLAYAYPDPKTQHGLLLITDKLELGLSELNLRYNKETLLEELSIFQPKENETIEDKLKEKWVDLESNVTRIYGRKLFCIAIDLVYHSVIAFNFNSEFVSKGWLELLAMGDSGQGKTQCLQRLIEHYEAGTIVSGETAKRTGLIYNLQQTGDRWFLQWGVIPLNDMRLVVIDEFHELDDEDIKNMTSLRDGIARVDRVVKAQTPSRTRLIYLCNPIGDPLSRWDFRVNAIQKLFKNQEDLRRIDFAITLTSGEVDVQKLSSIHTELEHKYSSQLCNMLIRWVWTRKPNQIHFSSEATAYILDSVIDLNKMFTPTIQLTETGDLRKKVAKLSAATAGMLFSTTDGENMNIELRHAEFAVAFLKLLYIKMDYEEYTKLLARNILDRDKKDEAKMAVKEVFAHIETSVYKSIISFLLQNNLFYKSDLEMVSGSREVVKKLITTLYARSLISLSGGNRIKKTASFIEILKEMEVELIEREVTPEDLPFG